MITMIAPLDLSSRRGSKVPTNQSLTFSRLVFDMASAALIGSSTIRMSPPRPVSVPSTDVV